MIDSGSRAEAAEVDSETATWDVADVADVAAEIEIEPET